MGREKKNKPRQDRTWVDRAEESGAEAGSDIWINTAPRTKDAMADGAKPTCLIQWGELEWYAEAQAVYQTAEDLMTCAAYADLFAALLKLGLDGEMVQRMSQEMMMDAFRHRTASIAATGGMLGSAETIGVMPGASSKAKAGVVMLQRGKRTGSLSPGGAREMAKKWMQTAGATEHDELVALTLEDLLGAGEMNQVNAFIGYMASMRELGVKERAEFRAEEAERLRLHVGLPPAPEPEAGG
ncbi:hypothetical protein ACIRPQ_28900 [Streptomyces sp. NPDC101213]|uniref:hypothetical protein n=1 Tax=Streptomyces sp. NPDC101213 TaxID=3366130 RepID=UPI0038267CB8